MPSRLSPARTVVANFGTCKSLSVAKKDADPDPSSPYDESIWVLEVVSGADWVSCGLSNGDVNVYDQERLHVIRKYAKPPGCCASMCAMTDLATTGDSHLLTTSWSNGEVYLLDVRQSRPALNFTLPGKEEALSVSLGLNESLAAVGSNRGLIHFYDVRTSGQLLGTYQDAHTDEVTRVRFQSPSSSLLLSAAEDGLVYVFDVSQPSEELAVKSVLNVMSPLRRVGFFGPSLEGVYCLTGSETMSVWHHESAQRICDFGVDVRQKLSTLSDPLAIDYLVDCSWSAKRQELSLLAGNHSGDACLYRVDAGSLCLSHMLQGGHVGDVRSWCPLFSPGMFVTVGEDARMCEWNPHGSNTSSTQIGEIKRVPRSIPPTRGGGPMRRPKSKTNVDPY